MKLSWLGHSGFRIGIEDQVLLLDPWLGNPLFDSARRGEAIAGATHLLPDARPFRPHRRYAIDIAKDLDMPGRRHLRHG